MTPVSRTRSGAAARSTAARVRVALDRPRLWGATAALAALVLCALLLAAAPGSLQIIVHKPPTGALAGRPGWERWCSHGEVRLDRERLAYCARIDGRVVDSTHGPARAEVHLAVVGDFHLVIVRLADGSATPSPGSRFTAVGPLVRARDGQREVQAFKVLRG
ncbi:MAG TPA: hypothetical protein VN880_02060 [Solirubrobacteraceae bacterium]|nr:hypothetical protein [Solirubrobacteraceae bacterium]